MALPTTDNIKALDFAYLGRVFVWLPAKPSIDLNGLDYAEKAKPFLTNSISSPLHQHQ